MLSIEAEGQQGKVDLTLKKFMDNGITDGRVLVGEIKTDNRRVGADDDFSYALVAGVPGESRQIIDKAPSRNVPRPVWVSDVVLELRVAKRVLQDGTRKRGPNGNALALAKEHISQSE